MRGRILTAMLAATLGVATSTAAIARDLSNDEIKKQMIQKSIAAYPGNCPCPYNSASNGSRCGKRSAYSRAGGYAPLCFPEDISNDLLSEWRSRHQ